MKHLEAGYTLRLRVDLDNSIYIYDFNDIFH